MPSLAPREQRHRPQVMVSNQVEIKETRDIIDILNAKFSTKAGRLQYFTNLLLIHRIRDTGEVYPGFGTYESTPDNIQGLNAYKFFELRKMKSSRDMSMQKNVGQKSQHRSYFNYSR